MISLTKDEVMQAVKQQLISKMDDAVVVAFADKGLLEKENQILSKAALKILDV